MKFSEFKYTRPDIEEVKNKLSSYISKFSNAVSSDIQITIIDQINEVRTEFITMSKIASIRYTMNTTDKFYEEEQTYFDRSLPVYNEIMHEYYSSLIISKFRDELESKYGKYLFDIASVTIKTMSPEIIDDLIVENSLNKMNCIKSKLNIIFKPKVIILCFRFFNFNRKILFSIRVQLKYWMNYS